MPPLKHLLEGMMGQTELLKQVVAAVQDTERGKHAPMTALLLEEQDRAQRQRQPAEDLDRSRTEVRSAPCCCAWDRLFYLWILCDGLQGPMWSRCGFWCS